MLPLRPLTGTCSGVYASASQACDELAHTAAALQASALSHLSCHGAALAVLNSSIHCALSQHKGFSGAGDPHLTGSRVSSLVRTLLQGALCAADQHVESLQSSALLLASSSSTSSPSPSPLPSLSLPPSVAQPLVQAMQLAVLSSSPDLHAAASSTRHAVLQRLMAASASASASAFQPSAAHDAPGPAAGGPTGADGRKAAAAAAAAGLQMQRAWLRDAGANVVLGASPDVLAGMAASASATA